MGISRQSDIDIVCMLEYLNNSRPKPYLISYIVSYMFWISVAIITILAYIAYQLFLLVEHGKENNFSSELLCRQVGLELHNRLVENEWKDLDRPNGREPKFYEPKTIRDLVSGKCLLLTGYTFRLEDEFGSEDREVFKVIDVLTGKVLEELYYGYGHDPAFGRGKRSKDENTIEIENEARAMHKQILENGYSF